MLYLGCIILRLKLLTETEEVSEVLLSSRELTVLFDVPVVLVSAVMIASAISSIVIAAVVLAFQMKREGQRQLAAARVAKARRLRWVTDGKEVNVGPPVIPASVSTHFPPTYTMGAVSRRFHLFLSHVARSQPSHTL